MTAEGLSAGRPRVPTWMPAGAVMTIVAAKLAYGVLVGPNDDEAYYWQWGQHLALSYFDHAPLHGWMQGLASLADWSFLAVRAMGFATLAGTALIFLDWAKRLAPGDAANLCWTMLAVYLATPLVFALTTLAYPDHWLLLLSLASVHCFALFFAERLEGGAGRSRLLYAGAALLGLAALAKYNAVLLGLAVAAAIVFDHRLRPLLREPRLYLAAALSLAVLAPVLIWNAEHGFASFRFQLADRFAPGTVGTMGEFSPERFGIFVLTSLAYMLPTLIVPLVLFLRRPADDGFAGALVRIGKWAFALSTLVIGALSFFAEGAPHWNILAFVVVLPLAALCFCWRWLLAAHVALGTVGAVGLTAVFAAYPLVGIGGREAAGLYGWEQVAARMQALQAETGAAGLASIFYGGASKLAFGAGPGVAVTAINKVHDNFDEWRDEAALAGRDLLILDEWGAIEHARPQFDALVELEDIEVTRFGQPIASYAIYLGRGYRGPNAP